MKGKLRNVCAPFVALLLIGLGFARRAKKKAINGDYILSIYFHAPSKKLFEFCIKWLIKNGFKFLSQQEVYCISQRSETFPKNSVIITVDDGWQTNKENVVAVANKYKIPVTIFVSTDPVESGDFWWTYIQRANKIKIIDKSAELLKTLPNKERQTIINQVKENIQLPRLAMTVDEVRDIIKSGFITVGAHTVSHPILPNCEDNESYYELKKSKELIEEWTGENVSSFAYPNGNYSTREIKYLKELGYVLAYSTKPVYLTQGKLQNNYELPRFSIIENISNAEAVCRMMGIWETFFNKNF